MTLRCTRNALLKLKRYKLSKVKQLGDEAQKSETPLGFLNIQDDETEAVDLEDITTFLENDVELDASIF